MDGQTSYMDRQIDWHKLLWFIVKNLRSWCTNNYLLTFCLFLQVINWLLTFYPCSLASLCLLYSAIFPSSIFYAVVKWINSSSGFVWFFYFAFAYGDCTLFITGNSLTELPHCFKKRSNQALHYCQIVFLGITQVRKC